MVLFRAITAHASVGISHGCLVLHRPEPASALSSGQNTSHTYAWTR